MIHEHDRHILYVDSNQERRFIMCTLLEDAGFLLVEAASAAEALNTLYPSADEPQPPSQNQPKILAVVLDVTLPDMSGYDLCTRIKAVPSTAALPIVQISPSVSEPPRRAAFLSGGADAYIAQPVHPTELLSLLDALIRAQSVEALLRFQSVATTQLTSSLDYDRTLEMIETVFTPHFADACTVCLRGQDDPHPALSLRLGSAADRLSPELREIALQVCSTGRSRFVDPSTIVVPLHVGQRPLGSLVFQFDGDRRSYAPAAVMLLEDLADRAALALQNANLLTTQQTAQAALVQSEKLATAGMLSAAIAHEINNPLEAITNLIFLIATSDHIELEVKEYAEHALSELGRLTHIARQSLGFYRELTGPTGFDLNESVEDTLNIYLKRFEAKHIAIQRSYTPDLAIVAVKGEIRQVISNILVNAYDALPEHGMLRIETHRCGDEVCFHITDNGHGIPEDVLKRIFEPFYTTKKDTGTGLGLWVSDTIVRKHGGRIEVDSRTLGDQRGTRFAVTLPITLKSAA